ncbi:MAG: hypothetical protein FWG79_07945, partial [Bacteroidales bacterium]|nr:hypothetical protein [Bacteroidales bacterium]
LGERTKIGMGMDIRINKNGRAGKKTLIELRHNLEKLSMPNINAYINYKSADLNAHGSNEIYSLWRRGFGLGAEYEKQITDNLNFNARVGMSHNTFSLGGYYVGEESPLKFHTDIGLHYKIPPIKFGKLNLGSEIEPIPAPQPKRQKIKKPKSRRLQQISCPAHQRKPHERPVTIFNKP